MCERERERERERDVTYCDFVRVYECAGAFVSACACVRDFAPALWVRAQLAITRIPSSPTQKILKLQNRTNGPAVLGPTRRSPRLKPAGSPVMNGKSWKMIVVITFNPVTVLFFFKTDPLFLRPRLQPLLLLRLLLLLMLLLFVQYCC